MGLFLSSENEEEEKGEDIPSAEYGFPMVSALESRLLSVDVTEVFAPPRVTIEAKKFGFKPGEAWDITQG